MTIHLNRLYIIWQLISGLNCFKKHRFGSILAQVMVWCLTAPSYYLNRCWRIISKVQWHWAISHEITQPLIIKIRLKIMCLNFHTNLTGVIELMTPEEWIYEYEYKYALILTRLLFCPDYLYWPFWVELGISLHYSNVMSVSWHLKSADWGWRIQANIIENMKALHWWPFVRGIHLSAHDNAIPSAKYACF